MTDTFFFFSHRFSGPDINNHFAASGHFHKALALSQWKGTIDVWFFKQFSNILRSKFKYRFIQYYVLQVN
jgi:hypothetical protein